MNLGHTYLLQQWRDLTGWAAALEIIARDSRH
jgi:hypothetical protein